MSSRCIICDYFELEDGVGSNRMVTQDTCLECTEMIRGTLSEFEAPDPEGNEWLFDDGKEVPTEQDELSKLLDEPTKSIRIASRSPVEARTDRFDSCLNTFEGQNETAAGDPLNQEIPF